MTAPVREPEQSQEGESNVGDAQRAAELAEELRGMMNQPTVLLYLSEFGLACVVRDQATRACLEEQLGEDLPDHLWSELAILGDDDGKLDLATVREEAEKALRNEAGNPEELEELEENEEGLGELAVRTTLGMIALACVAEGKGGKAALDARMTGALSNDAWEKLQSSATANLPKRREEWRQMRQSEMVEFPQYLFDAPPSKEQ